MFLELSDFQVQYSAAALTPQHREHLEDVVKGVILPGCITNSNAY